MFEVLVFVYENYFAGESCPEPAHLERKLNAVGFEPEEVADVVVFLASGAARYVHGDALHIDGGYAAG